MILAALGLVCGLAPGAIEHALVAPMVLAVSGRADARAPRALARGGRAAAPQPRHLRARRRSSTSALDRIRDGARRAPSRALPRTEGWYDAALAGARARWRARLTGAVQNGRMTSYLRSTFLVLGAADLGRAPGRRRPRWPRARARAPS